jgi:hypothetical protein
MKAKDIKTGATYRNSGAGRTQRHVLGVGPECAPKMAYASERPAGWPGVEYRQRLAFRGGRFWCDWTESRRMWLDSFASWAGSEVTE